MRNVTALHVNEFKIEKSNKLIVTIGESSIDKAHSIGIHVVYNEENDWKFISCKGIVGRVKVVQSMHERK